ncbi:hypothetical protein FACS1894125_2880 [Actinomycetota bacterium]|nr:hypothetical protein FACS1894125_2880 [Actinomycetota bacterium]
MKKLVSVLAVVVLSVGVGVVFTGCSEENSTEKVSAVQILVPDGVPLLNFTSVAADSENVVNDGKYEFDNQVNEVLGKQTNLKVVNGPDQLSAALLNDKPEIAVLPVNLAAKLYNDDKSYKMLSVATWGLNELVSAKKIESVQDLWNSRIYTFGKNETPGIVLRNLLQGAGLTTRELDADTQIDTMDGGPVRLVELDSAQSVVAALTKNPDAIGLLPEPVATTFALKQLGNTDTVFDLQKVWADVHGQTSSYPQSVLVVRSDIADSEAFKEYLNLLTLMIDDTHSTDIVESPDVSIDVVANKFKSVMFANKGAGVDALKSGRILVKPGDLFAGGINFEDNRKSLQDYANVVGITVDEDSFVKLH